MEVAVRGWLKGPGEGVLHALSRRPTSGTHGSGWGGGGLLSCVLVLSKDTEPPSLTPDPCFLHLRKDPAPSSSGLLSALLQ